jgi:hypothetical protein
MEVANVKILSEAHMRRPHFLAAAILILSVMTAVHAQKVSVDVDKTVNFTVFKTFGWAGGQMAQNPIVAEMIKTAITAELTARGLTFDAAAPNIRVSVMAATGIDIQGVGPSWNNEVYRSWGGYGNPNALMNVTSGTLLVDLLETDKNHSIWRGVAKKTLNESASGDLVKDAKSVEGVVKKAVEKMFAKYPVKKSK